MLLQPFIGSVIALKTVNQTMFAALICVVLAFLIRSPLLTLARQQWVWREQKPETRSARLQVLVELLIMAIAAWQLVLVSQTKSPKRTATRPLRPINRR